MPNYRRFFQPGGTYFFTLKTECNAPVFREPSAIQLLGSVIRATKERWPMDIVALVLLPDHLHSIWSLPSGDANYSARWGWLKKEFSRRYVAVGGTVQPTSRSRKQNRRLGVWQRRFWEHTIDDEEDFNHHFDYVHWNPVKHGYVTRPKDWPLSSFHRWVKAGVYDEAWGCGGEPLSVAKIQVAGE